MLEEKPNRSSNIHTICSIERERKTKQKRIKSSDYDTLLLDDDLLKVVNEVNRGKFGDGGGVYVSEKIEYQHEEYQKINLPVF